MDFEAHVTLGFYIGFKISHLKMVIDPIDNKIRKPRIGSASLEQFVEKLQTFLAKVVCKNFEAHEGIILAEGLGKEGEAEVIDLVVGHIEVNKFFIDGQSLGDCLGAIVADFVVGDVQTLQGAVVTP